ncbi:transposase [Desulfofalx alkaliphila]|uniref:transposase n=1 Tax=Desulfofalx alkaliphila TaxID=105483 RepID=UPI0004E0DCD0|nr:transposase [Desulfofalx alkaliphila]
MYPKEVKEQILKEVEEVGSVHKVAKRHEVAPTTVYGWLKAKKNNHKAWDNTSNKDKRIAKYIPSPKEFKELESENAKLKELLGEKDLEIHILRDLLKKNNPDSLRKLK